MIISTEANYNKVLKENQLLKVEYNGLIERFSTNHINNNGVKNNNINITNNTNNTSNKESNINSQIYKGVKTTPMKMNSNSNNSNHSNKYLETSNNLSLSNLQHTNISNKMEYLKNVLLKYLEAIALGDSFQIKILENVMFSVLGVTKSEKHMLDEKRLKSSFYYNLWYNAKHFISTKIYGTSYDDSFTPSSNRRKISSLSLEESKNNSDEKTDLDDNTNTSKFNKLEKSSNNVFSELNSHKNNSNINNTRLNTTNY